MDTVLASTAIWNEEPSHLKDFAKRHPLPCLAMVRRGYYRGIIQPNEVVYVHHLDAGQKVLAEAVKHPRRRVGGGRGGGGTNYYSLPTTYAGWFELLSEDGKPVQPIRGVEELAKVSPHRCIVREAFRAPFTAPGADNFSTERQRLLGVGEQLTIYGEVDVTFRGSRGGVATRRYLRCSGGDGDSVYLGFDVRAQFSPIADDGGTANSISGVHSLKGLLERFRLPVVVRLVCGNIPSRVERGFVPVFRLIGAYRDETVFMLPMRKDEEDEEAKLIAVSTREPLFLVGAKNTFALSENCEFHAMKTRCDGSLHSYMNSIQILVDLPDGRAISRGKDTTRVDRIKTGEISNPDSEEDELLLFEEIEEIYRYVREGGDPPQPKTRPVSTKAEVLTPAQNSTLRPPMTSRLRSTGKEAESREGATTVAEPSGAAIQTIVSEKEAATPRENANLNGPFLEEQIYQDIDKIRERKQLEKASRSKSPITAKFPLEAKRATTIITATESRVITQVTQSTTDDSKSKVESPESDGMVKSLRQVYLRSQQPSLVKPVLVRDKPKTPTLEDNDDDRSTLSSISPPVPPKLFESEADAANSGKILANLHRSVEAAEAMPPCPRPKSQPPKVPAKSKQRILSSDQAPPSTPSYPSSPFVDGKPAAAKGGSLQEAIEEPERQPGLTRARPTDAAAVYKAAEGEFSSSTAAAVAAAVTNPSLDTVILPQAKSIFSVTTAANRLTPGLLSGNLTADNVVSPPMNLNPQNHLPPLDHTIVRSTIPSSVSVKPDSNFNNVSTKHEPSDVAVFRHELTNSPTPGKHDSLSTFAVKQEELNPFDQSTVPDSFQSIRHERVNPISSNQNTTSSNPEHQLLLNIGSVNDQAPMESLSAPTGAATGQTESSHRPVVINTNSGSTRVNWASGVGSGPQGGPNSTVQVGNDVVGGLNTPANPNGVTTIRVSGMSNPDPKFISQGVGAGNTQIYVRFPNSPSGQTLYRPPGSLSGARVQSGTVYLTNGKAGDGDHWA